MKASQEQQQKQKQQQQQQDRKGQVVQPGKRTRMCIFPVMCLPTYFAPINPLNPELNPICYLLAILGAHHFLHVSRIRVKLITFRLLMSYIYI